jgi:selenocysteine-specific elongation factor
MKNIVVGTAGHIDHGKTSLVRALTGIETDRLQEEKRRGISIDLGFAHLKLNDSLRVAFIDVPGHERFIKNMLAGIGGIDAVMLVVAADESIKPQTREHFDICRLLRIPRGLVALTKIDLVDEEIADLVRLEVEEFTAGTFLESAPIVAVSVSTGAGLDELRSELVRLAAGIPSRDSTQNFRMPVDRVFVMQGFGTVATGTVLSGSVAPETEVTVQPGGKTIRVRGLQVHGAPAKRASAGQRAALNLAGVEASEICRGAVLCSSGVFRPTASADCLLELLPSAKPLKNRAPVHFHAGTAEVLAEVRTLDRSAVVNPGSTTAVRLMFREPMLLVPGDRFIIRMFSPVTTIGGGQVVDTFPPLKLRADSAERVRTLALGPLAGRIAMWVAESPGGLSQNELMIRTGASAQALGAAVPDSVLAIRDPSPWMLDRNWLKETAARWHRMVSEFHRAHPLVPGMRREELRTRELSGAPAFVFDLVLSQARTLTSTGEFVHLVSHRLALKADEEQAVGQIESAFEHAGLSVPAVKQVLESSGVDAVRARTLLQVLLRERRLIRISEDLVFHPSALTDLRSRLAEKKGDSFTVTDFKDWTGVSRKYAIPLLEHLDREKVTRREGEKRVVL